jgi:hypothetical protein
MKIFKQESMMQEHRQQPSKHGCGSQLGKAPAHFSHFEMF